MSDELAALAWPQVPEAPLLVLPTGSCEQHGPHLPMGTDTVVARAVAAGLVAVLRAASVPVVEAPVLAYGASGEHEGFPGTVSIGQDALRAVLIEIGRSARRWAGRLLVVNGHGGNAVPVAEAVRRLRYEGDDAAWTTCAVPGGDAHAGRAETSLLLALAPQAVRLHHAVAGDPRPIGELLADLRRTGVAGVSANGVLGDPAGASAAEGSALLADLVERTAAAVTRWAPGQDGRLDEASPVGAA
jgi:mycofactocin system creatininase family protein